MVDQVESELPALSSVQCPQVSRRDQRGLAACGWQGRDDTIVQAPGLGIRNFSSGSWSLGQTTEEEA